MLETLLVVVAPVFGVAAAGWFFAGFREVDLGGLTDIVLYLAVPALVFHSLATTTLGMGSMLLVGGGVVAQIAACGVACWISHRATGIPGRGLTLTALFPNTGNLGLPLALFAFGQEGLDAAVIVFTAVSIFHYSLGLVIVSGRAGPAAVLRMPVMHAAALGLLCTLLGWRPPDAAMRGVELLGDAAVPVMLVSLGIRMRTVRLQTLRPALLAVVLRMAPGLAAAAAWVTLMDLEGAARGVVLLTGVLPSAVMNFVLAEGAGEPSEEVASAILLGTVVSVVAIPVVLNLL
jgi:predicted permease